MPHASFTTTGAEFADVDDFSVSVPRTIKQNALLDFTPAIIPPSHPIHAGMPAVKAQSGPSYAEAVHGKSAASLSSSLSRPVARTSHDTLAPRSTLSISKPTREAPLKLVSNDPFKVGEHTNVKKCPTPRSPSPELEMAPLIDLEDDKTAFVSSPVEQASSDLLEASARASSPLLIDLDDEAVVTDIRGSGKDYTSTFEGLNLMD